MRKHLGALFAIFAVLSATSSASAQPSTKPVAKSYKGSITACSESDASRYRFSFVQGGKYVETVMVDPGKTQSNVRVAKGSYSVKISKLAKGKYVTTGTAKVTVSKDGWTVKPACGSTAKAPKKKPSKKTPKKGFRIKPRRR